MPKRPTWCPRVLLLAMMGCLLLGLKFLGERGVEAQGQGKFVVVGAQSNEARASVEAEEIQAMSRESRSRPLTATRLFAFDAPANAADLSRALPAPTREIHYVRIDAATLTGKRSPFWQPAGKGRLEVPLPKGGSLVVLIQDSVMTGPEQFTSTGVIEGRPASRVVFGYSGGFLNGSIEDPVLGAFALRTATDQLTQFYRVDPALVAGCSGPRLPVAAATPSESAPLAADISRQAAAAQDSSNVVIHVMMVHTAAALPTMTGLERTHALHSGFLAAVEKMNVALAASAIEVRVKLVRVHETNYPQDSLPPTLDEDWHNVSLTALWHSSDGVMDDVHAARDASGADMVCLALQRPDFKRGGLSFLLVEPGRPSNPEYAYSIVQYGNIAATNVVTHEFGHVLGCAHDRANAEDPGAFPYSYGHRFLGADGRWYHDIMSYPRLPGTFGPVASELSVFSNPRLRAQEPVSVPLGVPVGVPGESDAARTIDQMAFAASNYRLQTESPVSPGTLLNVSTRAFVGRGEQVLIGGFVVNGARPKRLLVRGAGPALRPFGVSDALPDPVLQVFDGSVLRAGNDNWSGGELVAAMAQVAAFPFEDGSADSSLVVSLSPGAYTAVLEGKGTATGSGLLEVYDLEASSGERVVNLATRGYVGKDGGEMVGGFVVQGIPGETKRILVRVLGPTLSRPPFLLSEVLDDPVLELRDAAGELLLTSDDWSADAIGGASTENDFKPRVATHGERQIFATGHAPPNRREPCMLVDLRPGNYTVIVRPYESRDILLDQPAQPGVGIIEVYEVGR